MKTIDLTAVKVRRSLSDTKETELNLAHEIGDAIYRNSRSIPELRFGERLYDSTGPIEVSEDEIRYIKDALVEFFAWAQVAVNKIIGD